MAKTTKSIAPTENAATSRPELPGSTLVWVLLAGATVWFAARLWAVRGTLAALAEEVGVSQSAITGLVTFALPTMIAAALVVGASVGLALRVWAPLAVARDPRVSMRLVVGAAAGLVAAGVTGAALLVSGHPTVAVWGVASAAALGGLISAGAPRVLAAGLAGALAVAVLQFLFSLPAVISPVRGLLDGSGTGPEVADAYRQMAMITGGLSGVAAGVLAYLVLRRLRVVGLGGHIAAGGAAGAFLLISEVVSRITLPILIDRVGGLAPGDVLVLQMLATARLNEGLMLFFAGAVTALILLGRSKPKRQLTTFTPRTPPEQAKPD
ncbi:MAG: hypothetical protein GEU94_19515 [Micromonosporaceae bacterium]|nr:hypothetical protein [Micromonosporaceae bacterium]